MNEFASLIETKFTEYSNQFFNKEPKKLYEPLAYTMESGGKRIRPQLALLVCKLFGGDIDKAMLPAYGVELFHNFTLLHDDIMDNSELRRGRLSVFKKFGLNSGILSGDLMMVLALKLASEDENGLNKDMYELMVQTSIELYEGQQYDVDFEDRNDVRQEEYLKMIELKTSVLIACAMQIGAIIAGASVDYQSKIYEFGRNIGLSFQIQDDYLDTFGDEQVGKKIGGDILNNKKTLLLISALQKADAKQLEALNKWIATDNDDDAKIKAVSQLYIDTGAMEYCRDLSKKYFDDAIVYLNQIEDCDPIAKKQIFEVAQLIINRAF
jgi:geranylgeranyl diphosphate synthase type II